MRNGCPKDEFDFLEVIGAGSFGSVHRAEEKNTHREVAIKIMKRKFESPTECDILLECKIIQLLPFHPNIVQIYDTFFSPTSELYFVMEYMNGGNLFQLINHKRDTDTYFTPKELRNIMKQTLAAVSHIHVNQIFHRDLKPENLLLTISPNGLPVVKLADFGLARETSSSPPYTEYVSTRWYRAPEVLLRSSNYCCAVDLWAVGTIFAELITRQPLFPGESEIDQLYCICKVLGSPGNKVLTLATKKKNLRPEKKASPGFARRKTIDESTNESNFPLQRKPSSTSTISTISVLDGGGEWREGVKLAHRIGFEFPHLRPQPLDTVIPQATSTMLDLLRQFLFFNPQSRLKASDALQHSFFTEVDQDEQTDDIKSNDMEIMNTNTTTAPVNIPPPLPNIQTSVSSSSYSQISPSFSSIETMSTIIEDHNEPSGTISSHVTITQISNEQLLNENIIMNEVHHPPSKENSILFNNNNHHSSTSTGKRRQTSVDLTEEAKLRKRDIDLQHPFDDNNQMDLDEHIHTHRQLMDHSFDNNNNNSNEILNDSNTIITDPPTHPYQQDDNSSTSSKSGNISGESDWMWLKVL